MLTVPLLCLQVARGDKTDEDGVPMLKITRMFDPWGFSIIDFGDILLPGMLIAFALRLVVCEIYRINCKS